MLVDAIALDRIPDAESTHHTLDAGEIITVENEDFDDDLRGFKQVTLRNGERWLAKIDAAALAQVRAAAGATIVADNTGLRAIFFEEAEERAYVEVLLIVGWRTFLDGRAAEPVFAVEPDGVCRGYVDAEGCVIPLRVDRRRSERPVGFVEWLNRFVLRYHSNYEPRKPRYIFDLNPELPIDPLDDRPNLVAGRPEDEAAIKADIALGMSRNGFNIAA